LDASADSNLRCDHGLLSSKSRFELK